MIFNRSAFYLDFVTTRHNNEVKKGEIIPLHEIAKEIGIDTNTLSRVLLSQDLPSSKALIKICRWMGKKGEDYVNG